MWTPLRHSAQTEFYAQLHEDTRPRGEDWLPMLRAVETLQSLPVAKTLFAFTSMSRFHVTTAPSYRECLAHCSISVDWHPSANHFHLAFGRLAEGWHEDRPPEIVCGQEDFSHAIQPLMERLLASRPAPGSASAEVPKKFKIPADQIRVIMPNLGSCFASDRITVDGAPVGYMYRERPDDDLDSGWRFFAGDETQEYADDPAKLAIYDVNTICNYDPAIIPYLGEPIGSAFGRDPSQNTFTRAI